MGKVSNISTVGITKLWKRIGAMKKLKFMTSLFTRLWKKMDLLNRIRRLPERLKMSMTNLNELSKLLRGVDGINLWWVSRMFTRVALSRENLEEKMFNGNLVVQLAPKFTRELSDAGKKQEIVDKIKELEGFEIFRLSLLEDCQIVYKELLTPFGVTRWVEVPLD